MDSLSRSGACFEVGFRPFFLVAALFGLLTMVLWAAQYAGLFALTLPVVSASQWHAHEMVYGYAMAVVAGFLLTAVRNWTGIATLSGLPLFALVLTWALARLAAVAEPALRAAALFDALFGIGLFAAVAAPVLAVRQWRQLGILVKLLLLAAGNALYYAGAFAYLDTGVSWGLYGGLFLLVSLVLTIGGRVLPGFIERGVGYDLRIPDPRWLTGVNILLFLPFFVAEVFLEASRVAGVFAILLCLLGCYRLTLWHTPGIWRRPLLWGLYLAVAFIVLGFALYAAAVFATLPKTLAIHAFGLGGIGMATLAMMARVALGHTGRSVYAPPRAAVAALLLLLTAVLVRVLGPVVVPAWYAQTVVTAQLLWISAFALFAARYAGILLQPRVDAAET